jgi:hypothetical protein
MNMTLPLITSGIGTVLAFTTMILLARKSRWGWITQAIQTGSWLVVGPLTGQWGYMLTGLVFPVISVRAFLRWTAEEQAHQATQD